MKLMVNGTWRGDVAPTLELDAQRMIHAGTLSRPHYVRWVI